MLQYPTLIFGKNIKYADAKPENKRGAYQMGNSEGWIVSCSDRHMPMARWLCLYVCHGAVIPAPYHLSVLCPLCPLHGAIMAIKHFYTFISSCIFSSGIFLLFLAIAWILQLLSCRPPKKQRQRITTPH